jgi:hypothetical protein
MKTPYMPQYQRASCMGLTNSRVARPYRADEILEILHPGLRCASPRAIIASRFAAFAWRVASPARPIPAEPVARNRYWLNQWHTITISFVSGTRRSSTAGQASSGTKCRSSMYREVHDILHHISHLSTY